MALLVFLRIVPALHPIPGFPPGAGENDKHAINYLQRKDYGTITEEITK